MPVRNVPLVHREYSRLFVIENGAAPQNVAKFQGLWKANAFTWSQGAITLIRIPDPTQYGAFITVDEIPGQQGTPTLTIMARYIFDLSDLLRMARRGCPSDYQVHMGACKNPSDFQRGWQKILVVERAKITNYTLNNFGALGPDERGIVDEEVPVEGQDAYEIKQMTFAEKAGAQVLREVVDVFVCDAASCGLCGLASDGCQVVLAVVKSGGASPGIASEIVYTVDGGNNWQAITITSLGATIDPNAGACIGSNVIVISAADLAIHWASILDVTDLSASAVWTKVTSGINAAGGPRALVSVTPTWTWIVGLAGYIYIATDPTSGVAVQDAGVATAQQLNSVDAIDVDSAVAVGNSNTVVYTFNGGQTWASVIGPAVGVNLNVVRMLSQKAWLVGTAGGKLFYTLDGGTTWTEKTFPGSGSGQVRDIVFVNNTVGYMAHSTSAPVGRIFRTIDGGNSWYLMPEDTNLALPTQQYIASLAVCTDPNKVWGGGLATAGTDGILVQGG